SQFFSSLLFKKSDFILNQEDINTIEILSLLSGICLLNKKIISIKYFVLSNKSSIHNNPGR
ncbi:hypothetical protein L9F63_002430, partial [Diploptera punctata]